MKTSLLIVERIIITLAAIPDILICFSSASEEAFATERTIRGL